MFDRFTDNAKRLMTAARREAMQLRHEYIGAEHMLLALLQPGETTAQRMLARLGVDLEALRTALMAQVVPGSEPVTMGQLPFTPEAKRVLEATMYLVQELGHAWIGTGHLLAGMARSGAKAADVLQAKGLSAERLRAAVVEVIAGVAATADRSAVRALLISNSTMHGGGYLEHCATAIRDFLGARKTVLFAPYALHDHDAYAAKATAAFATLGHELVSWHQVRHSPYALDKVDAVFLGGGNTFRLLAALQHHALLPAIRRCALAGMPYIGSSAGTNVATPTIRTTNDMPIVQPATFDALGLVPFQINPHYLDPDPNSTHMGETREERLRQFHEEHSTPVLGLREGCMLRVEGNRLELFGTTRARLFRRGAEPEEFAPPCELSFLLQPQAS